MSENERTRVLEMLKNGVISVDEAEKLLLAMEEPAQPEQEAAVALKDNRGRKPKKLRIQVDASDEMTQVGNTKVNVNIPISLIKSLGPIVTKSMPKEAKTELEKQGIDLAAIMQTVEELVDSGLDEDIVNVDVGDDGEKTKVRIYVE